MMRLISFERGDGTKVFINPQLVRAVAASDQTRTYIQFDLDHVILVKGTADDVVRALTAGV